MSVKPKVVSYTDSDGKKFSSVVLKLGALISYHITQWEGSVPEIELHMTKQELRRVHKAIGGYLDEKK